MSYFPVFVILLLLICQSLGHDDLDEGVNYTTDDFKENAAKKNHFVMFYAPWCEHCKRLAPAWSQLSQKFAKREDLEVAIAKVDCTKETALCSEHDVTGYPTLKFFKAGETEGLKFRGTRDLSSLSSFVFEQMGTKDDSVASDVPATKEGPLELTEDSFHSHIATGGHFVKFYAPWCGHCQKLAPTWEELARSPNIPTGVSIAKVDCTVQRRLCNEYDVKGYPTMLWLDQGKKVEKYSGSRTLEDLLEFIGRMTESSMPSPASPEMSTKAAEEDAVIVLNGSTFEQNAASGLTFVKFFAPWCGHCKRLAPVWAELAVKLQSEPTVRIAKVDCTLEDSKELCNAQEVDGFPTIYLYQDGSKVSEYTGSRSLEDLYEFVKKHLPGKKDEL